MSLHPGSLYPAQTDLDTNHFHYNRKPHTRRVTYVEYVFITPDIYRLAIFIIQKLSVIRYCLECIELLFTVTPAYSLIRALHQNHQLI